MKQDWKPGTMIYPLPAALVTCGSCEEEYNIITIAWVGTICTNPPMCYISVRPERHSYPILKKNMEFVINLTTKDMAFATDWCGVRSGKDYKKFQEMKLTPGKASMVQAPIIEESPLCIECRVKEIVALGSHHQFKDLSNVIASIKNRNYKFIIYMDDLSFEEFEIEYKFLKAVIEGGVETKPDNILIYATSNRRHLIKETWNDRNDMETTNGLHRSDTIEEKMSLVNRFGCQICYSKPSNKEYYDIVIGLARKSGLDMTDEELMAEANKWELSHGGISGRTAQQFINHCLGMQRSE